MGASLGRPIPIPMMDGFGPEYWTGTQATSRPGRQDASTFHFGGPADLWDAETRRGGRRSAVSGGRRAIRFALTDLDFDLPRRCFLLLG